MGLSELLFLAELNAWGLSKDAGVVGMTLDGNGGVSSLLSVAA